MRSGSTPFSRSRSRSAAASARAEAPRPPPCSTARAAAAASPCRPSPSARTSARAISMAARSGGPFARAASRASTSARSSAARSPGGRLERRVEPPQRLLVVRREGEGLAPERGGAVEPRRVVPQAGELRRERPALGALGARAPRLELPRQLLLLPGAGEARLEGRGRAAVVGIEGEHRAPGPDRLLGLAEVAVEDLRHAAVEGLASLDVSALALRGGAVGAGELEERVGARGGALHRLAGRGARRVEGERARERPERVARPPEPLLLHLGEPLEEADPLPRVRGPRRGQLEHLGEPRPLARLGEERREGGRGLGAARVRAERRLEVPARARGIAEPLLARAGRRARRAARARASPARRRGAARGRRGRARSGRRRRGARTPGARRSRRPGRARARARGRRARSRRRRSGRGPPATSRAWSATSAARSRVDAARRASASAWPRWSPLSAYTRSRSSSANGSSGRERPGSLDHGRAPRAQPFGS